MARTTRFSLIVLVALATLLMGAFITAPVPSPALAPVTAPAPVELPTADGADAPTDTTPTATVEAVPSDSTPPAQSDSAGGAVPSDSAGDAVPSAPADGADTATADDSADWFDPTDDTLPADAPEVCQLLDMGAAACDSFVHPEPGEISVAVIYVEDDEYAIDQIIAYDEHGPVEYVNFWEGGTLPTE